MGSKPTPMWKFEGDIDLNEFDEEDTQKLQLLVEVQRAQLGSIFLIAEQRVGCRVRELGLRPSCRRRDLDAKRAGERGREPCFSAKHQARSVAVGLREGGQGALMRRFGI